MASRFEQVIKEHYDRFTRNGFLCGDLVRIKQEAFTGPWSKTQSVEKINMLREQISRANADMLGNSRTVANITVATKRKNNVIIPQ